MHEDIASIMATVRDATTHFSEDRDLLRQQVGEIHNTRPKKSVLMRYRVAQMDQLMDKQLSLQNLVQQQHHSIAARRKHACEVIGELPTLPQLKVRCYSALAWGLSM